MYKFSVTVTHVSQAAGRSDVCVVSMRVRVVLVLCAAAVVVGVQEVAAAEAGGELAPATRYTFYRHMGNERGQAAAASGTRRVFGGETAELSSYPAAAMLLDRYWTGRCTAAVVAPRWVLTAAHCVVPQVAYVKYNTRRPAASGDVAAVHYVYRHPGYRVVEEDEGRGVDVTLLNHDVGLVRTRKDMVLATQPALNPLRAMRLHNPADLRNEDVQVLGFGYTERSSLGDELFAVRLRLVECERPGWLHCVCGRASTTGLTAANMRSVRGVCSGDSGGPVLYQGAQVGVTSMGPLECSSEHMDPTEGATSVFTALYQYAEIINGTIQDTDAALRMERISAGTPRALRHVTALLTEALLLVQGALVW